MQQIFRATSLVAILALAGCSTGTTTVSNIGPTLAQPNPALQAAPLTPARPSMRSTAIPMR